MSPGGARSRGLCHGRRQLRDMKRQFGYTKVYHWAACKENDTVEDAVCPNKSVEDPRTSSGHYRTGVQEMGKRCPECVVPAENHLNSS